MQFKRERNSGNQATPGDLHQHGIDIGHLVQHLEAKRALSGDDMGMVEGWNHGIAFLVYQAFGFDLGLVLGLADYPRFGTECADCLELVFRHQFGHANDAGHASLPCGVGECTAVIPGRHGSYSGGFGFELEYRVHRATQFECTGGLQVLVCQQYIA